MISDSKLHESLGRLSALRYFPTNPFALVAVGEIVRKLCSTDADADALVCEMLSRANDWPGPMSVREAWSSITKQRRDEESRKAEAEQDVRDHLRRDEHEISCPGYSVQVRELDRTVYVALCWRDFGQHRCRKAQGLDHNFRDGKLKKELAARPGFRTEEEALRERHNAPKGTEQ